MLNTAPDKTLGQKVNIITAMSSDGEVWIALTTCNTDSDVLMLFMTHLASALSKQAADWRSSTVFLLDGVCNYPDFLFCVFPVGCLPQVGREPCLLQAPGSADRPQCPVQLLGCASGAVVRSAQAGRHQPDQRRHREAVSAYCALIFLALSRTSCRWCTPRWRRSRGAHASPASGTASSTCSCTSHLSPFEPKKLCALIFSLQITVSLCLGVRETLSPRPFSSGAMSTSLPGRAILHVETPSPSPTLAWLPTFL